MAQSSTPGPETQPDPRRVQCVLLGRSLPGLAAPPMPGELGQRLFDHVSQEAWGRWLAHSRMLVNEYRLNLSTPEARRFLAEQCERYFFGGGAAPPPEFTPPAS